MYYQWFKQKGKEISSSLQLEKLKGVFVIPCMYIYFQVLIELIFDINNFEFENYIIELEYRLSMSYYAFIYQL